MHVISVKIWNLGYTNKRDLSIKMTITKMTLISRYIECAIFHNISE